MAKLRVMPEIAGFSATKLQNFSELPTPRRISKNNFFQERQDMTIRRTLTISALDAVVSMFLTTASSFLIQAECQCPWR